MQVLVVTCAYPEGKGKERSAEGVFIEDEAKALRSHGHTVTVLAGAKEMTGTVVEDEVTVRRVKTYGPIFNPSHIVRIIVSMKYDVVHAGFADFSGLYACIISKLTGKPVVVSVRGYEVKSIELRKNLGMRFNRILSAVTYFVLRACDTLVVPSFFLKMLTEGWGVAGDKIHVVRPVLRDTFSTLQEESSETDGQTILTVAMLTRGKGIEHGIRAMKGILKEVPQARYLIAGEGPLKQQYLRLARELNVEKSVKFLGRVPPHEVQEYYKKSSVYLMASDAETFGISKIEANACGKPVVARAIDGIGEGIVHGYNGYLFSDNNEIVHYIVKLLTDKKLRLSMAANCRKEAQKYSADYFAYQVEGIYKELLSRRKAHQT